MAGSIPSYRGQGSTSGVSFAGIRRFFRWWGRELSALVPAGLRPLPRSTSTFIWVEAEPTMARVRHFVGDRLEEVGRVDLAAADATAHKLAFNAIRGRYPRQPIGLSIPAAQVLRKQVTLPLATRDNLGQVLGFELSRHTPFNAEHAWFDFSELGEDSRKGQLEVKLTVAGRQPIDEGIGLLRGWGHMPEVVVPADELIGTPRYANLLPPHLRPGASLRKKLVLATLALMPVLLLGAALAIPLWQKRELANDLLVEVARSKRQAAVIDGLRQELDRASGEYQFLLEKKFKRPAVVAILEETTRLLPDDTWLNQLEVKGQEVLMSGETNSSSGLVRMMEKSSLMEEAGFRSPLVKSRSNVERFQLAARLREPSLADALARQQAEAAARPAAPKAGGKQAGVKGGDS